jgi:hypothetical protein
MTAWVGRLPDNTTSPGEASDEHPDIVCRHDLLCADE